MRAGVPKSTTPCAKNRHACPGRRDRSAAPSPRRATAQGHPRPKGHGPAGTQRSTATPPSGPRSPEPGRRAPPFPPGPTPHRPQGRPESTGSPLSPPTNRATGSGQMTHHAPCTRGRHTPANPLHVPPTPHGRGSEWLPSQGSAMTPGHLRRGSSRPGRAVGSPAGAAGGQAHGAGPTTPPGTQPATQGCLSSAPQAAKPGSELNLEH